MSNTPNSFVSNSQNLDYRPLFYNMTEHADILLKLVKNGEINVCNTIEKQIEELVKIQNPETSSSAEQVKQQVESHLNGLNADEYGTWVYYPWNKTLVHLLNKEEFIKVRTNRNIYKINPEEIEQLQTKKIAVIGLSVGQSVAQTIAMERICGELRLADFDTLELGNLNRINSGVQYLGLPKVIVAARRIAELDPYIEVKCWRDGINENNIEAFLNEDGKADILVEECDSLSIKILSRIKARELGIPVIMDTNDKGMIDVERFDLEKDLGIFHGRLPQLDSLPFAQLIAQLNNLTFQEKVGYLTLIIGFENISDEMRLSLSQMNKTITGWPQLASAVTLGAAAVTDTCRRMLLGKFKNSGRFFVHFDELIK